MPSPFDITVATNTIALDNKRAGIATFTVKNDTRRRIRATAKVSTQPPNAAQWLTIRPPEGGGVADSPDVRDFPVEGTVQFQIDVAIPPDAPPGGYTVKLIVAEEINPDENFSESPEVTFVVPEPPKPEPRRFPRWIIPAIIIAVLLVVAIIVVAVVSSNNQRDKDATDTAVALANAETSTAVANMTATQAALETQNAANAEQTASAQTATAAVNMTATQVALERQNAASANATGTAAALAGAETATAIENMTATHIGMLTQTPAALTQIKLNACPTYGDSDPLATPPPYTRILRRQRLTLPGSTPGFMSGSDVRAVQTRLCELGYTPGGLDGVYGPNAEQAVREFQTVNGLQVDGQVGPNTWNKLFSADAIRAL